MGTKPCTHPDHVDGQSCLDYSVGCHMLCECCMGIDKAMAWEAEQSAKEPIKFTHFNEIPIYVEEKSIPQHVTRARQRRALSSNWVVPDWE